MSGQRGRLHCTSSRIRRPLPVSGTNEADKSTFDISVDECILAIIAGDEFFVDRIGEKALIRIRPPRRPQAGHPRAALRPGVDPYRGYYLATSPNDTETDNLRSLK